MLYVQILCVRSSAVPAFLQILITYLEVAVLTSVSSSSFFLM